MGLFFKSDPAAGIRSAEEQVRQCERMLATQKQNREIAKKSGNYKNASKNYRSGSKVGTVYDANVWTAEEHLKRAKAALAAAKKK